MNPTRRLDLAEVEPVPVDPTACRDLLRQAGSHLVSARTIAADDPEGAFVLGYDGCRKAALATMLAVGTRPRGDAHHETTFNAAAAIAAKHLDDHDPVCRALDDATDLRRVRHATQYCGETVAAEAATDAIDILAALLGDLSDLVDRLLP